MCRDDVRGGGEDQLGFKLQPRIAPLRIPVVDHVEMPSENCGFDGFGWRD